MTGSPKTSLLGLAGDDLLRTLREVAPQKFRATQIEGWIYEKRARTFDEMSNLPKALREALDAQFSVGALEIAERTPSGDGSEKFLFTLPDGAKIEAVYMQMPRRRKDADESEIRPTVCISSQAGCAVDCSFCVTGRMGAGRNLTAGEIVGQYLAIAREKGIEANGANVVFMGMGEPLLNVAQVLRSLDLFERELSPRRITVSTSGIVPGIEALAGRPRLPNLAISLSAPDDETRSSIMPINRTYPIAELFAALRRWPLLHGRRITFEYVLIAGVNDSLDKARALAALVSRLPSKVNLIPLNESPEWLPGMKRPTREVVDAFAKVVLAGNVPVTVRWSKGLDANAACGQLKGRETPRRPRA